MESITHPRSTPAKHTNQRAEELALLADVSLSGSLAIERAGTPIIGENDMGSAHLSGCFFRVDLGQGLPAHVFSKSGMTGDLA